LIRFTPRHVKNRLSSRVVVACCSNAWGGVRQRATRKYKAENETHIFLTAVLRGTRGQKKSTEGHLEECKKQQECFCCCLNKDRSFVWF